MVIYVGIFILARVLWWDWRNWYGYDNWDAYRYEKYLPFQTIDDLIDQFNYVGYHDVCIYPSRSSLTDNTLVNTTDDRKGVRYVHAGHSVENQTGNYKKNTFAKYY